MVWTGAKHVAALNRLMGSDPPPHKKNNIPLLTTASQTTIHANDKKSAHIRFHSKRPHTITKMNDSINIDSKITGLMNARS
jgi:hypothetical protein